MTQQMLYAWAMTATLGSLAMVTAAGTEEKLDQSEIDQFLHNQINQAGLSKLGFGLNEARADPENLEIGDAELKAKLDIPINLDKSRLDLESELGTTFRRRPANSNKRRGAKACRTHSGGEGLCLDLSDCPALILNINALIDSVCFKGLFNPGICCPITNKDPTTTTTKTSTTTQRPTITTATTAPRPRPRPVHTVKHYPCGQRVVRHPRIINGTETYPGQWPWAAAIYIHGNKKTEFWCGGSLISKRYILTADHCTRDSKGKTFSPLQFSVRLGDHNIFSLEDDAISSPQTYKVQSIKVHSDHNSKPHRYYNDLALLKLDQDVDFTDYIIPVCLPTEVMAEAHFDHMHSYMATVVGWGRTSPDRGEENPTLLSARVPIWRNEPCDEQYPHNIEKIFLCAGYIEGGIDACQGDSGGPLTLYTGSEWTQIGIVSHGDRCAQANKPGVYTRLTEFLPWIKRNADMA